MGSFTTHTRRSGDRLLEEYLEVRVDDASRELRLDRRHAITHWQHRRASQGWY